MKIDVIGAAFTWENKQIVNELQKSGVLSEFIIPKYISYDIQNSPPKIKLFYHSHPYELPNVALLRGGFLKRIKDEGRLFLNVLTTLGCKIVNPPSNFLDRHKVYSAVVFALNNIPHPRTLLLRDKGLLDKLDFSPVIIKPDKGARGNGIRKVEKIAEITKLEEDSEFYQSYLKQGATDIRVIVIGDKVIGAMQRTATNGEWRSNVALGASTMEMSLTNEMKDAAIHTVKVLGCEYAGVDLIKDEIEPNKYYVIEVNKTPQFQAFTECTGINVAKEIAQYLLDKLEV